MIDFKRHGWWSGKSPRRDRPLDDALLSICKAAPPRRYLEIGTREGASLLAVLRHSNPTPELLVLCDTWSAVHGGTDRGSHDHIENLIAGEGFAGETRFLDGRSQELVPKVRLRNFDLILVDGDHSAEAATQDLGNSWPLLKLGGHLILDDTNTKALGLLAQHWAVRPDADLVWVSGRAPGCAVLEKIEGAE